MDSHLRADYVAFWNRLIPIMLKHSERWTTADFSSEALIAGLWTLAAVCAVLLVAVVVLGTLRARHSMMARKRMAAAGRKLAVGTATVGEKQLINRRTC